MYVDCDNVLPRHDILLNSRMLTPQDPLRITNFPLPHPAIG